MHSKAIFNRLIRPLTMPIRKNYLADFDHNSMKNIIVFSKSAIERVDPQVSLLSLELKYLSKNH